MNSKPYTLHLQFESFEKLWVWKNEHLSNDLALYRGTAIDPEFKGIGRAPKNSVIVRLADDPYRQSQKLEPTIVEKGSL